VTRGPRVPTVTEGFRSKYALLFWFTPTTATVIKGVFVWLTVLITALSAVHYLIRSKYILEESAPK
jgi:hypothetical protein